MEIKFYGHTSGKALSPINPLDKCITHMAGISYTNDHDYYIRTKGERLLEGTPINLHYTTEPVLIDTALTRQIYAVYNYEECEPVFTKIDTNTVQLEFKPCK